LHREAGSAEAFRNNLSVAGFLRTSVFESLTANLRFNRRQGSNIPLAWRRANFTRSARAGTKETPGVLPEVWRLESIQPARSPLRVKTTKKRTSFTGTDALFPFYFFVGRQPTCLDL
jgi:hypothetical protein